MSTHENQGERAHGTFGEVSEARARLLAALDAEGWGGASPDPIGPATSRVHQAARHFLDDERMSACEAAPRSLQRTMILGLVDALEGLRTVAGDRVWIDRSATSLIASLSGLADALGFDAPQAPARTEATSSPGDDEQANEGPRAEWVVRALVILQADPGISNRALAKRVGRHASTVGRDPTIRRFREANAGTPPTGHRTDGGGVEAIDDEGG